MKKQKTKTASQIFAVLLACIMALPLAACGSGGNSPGTSAPETTEPGTSAPARLTADEARDIYNAWLGNRAELSDYTIGDASEAYEHDGEAYYLFRADEMSRYWYNILVHMETGALLFMMTPDGEDPETTIEPLDDWYDEHYAP